MAIVEVEKVIIVEGRSDKRKVESIISEPVEIICTNGTLGTAKLDELIDALYDKEVYILVDSDEAGRNYVVNSVESFRMLSTYILIKCIVKSQQLRSIILRSCY